MLASAGVWSGQVADASQRDLARETFLQIVEEVTSRGVSAVLEFICADAAGRAEQRERSDPLLNRNSVLAALGHGSIDSYLHEGVSQREAVRDAMLTQFDVPLLEVRTEDDYEPPLDEIVDWVIASTS